MKKKTILLGVIIAVLAAFWLFVNIFFDYIAVSETGGNFTQVFWTDLWIKAAAQVIGFIIIFILLYFSALITRQNLRKINMGEILVKRKWIIRLVTFVIALLSSSVISGTIYSKFLFFINTVWFGKADPIFNIDIGYYIFQRPFMMSCLEMLMSVWYVCMLFVALGYILFCSVFGEYRMKELLKQRSVVIHNIVNILIALALNCMTYKFKAEDILFRTFGQVELTGAGYTDVNIWRTYYKIAPFVLSAIVIISMAFISKKKIKRTVVTIAVFPAMILITAVIAFFTQVFIVTPNEVIMENSYIQHNMDYTKSAYGIANIQEKDFEVKNDLTPQDIRDNAETINNIRIIDFPSTLTSINQLQGIRNYYSFTDLDIVPYRINGKNTAVAISPREMSKDNLKDSPGDYANQRMRYTHGMGAVMVPVNKVTEQGQPYFLIKDIPSRSMEDAPSITQPRVYYGELTNDYVIVNNEKYKELDYSEDQQEIEFKYDGNGGMRIDFLNRLLFSVKYGDFRMLITNLASADSKILINRNVRERAEIAAPFLQFDKDPYLLIDKDGRMKWIIDAYTTSNYYPYAQHSGEYNYIRNSARAVVDAYDGTVDLYIIDENDPIIMAYNKMYPAVFKQENFPDDLAQHLRYPEYLFKTQSGIYAKYHVSNATIFYNKNDFWEISQEKYSYKGEIKEVEPYYNMMDLGLDDGKGQELVLMIPYSLKSKQNMVGWMAVRCEGENYGNIIAYKFQKDTNIYGVLQMENRIDADPEISKEITLWGQGGSNVIRGNMLVIPVKQSLLYVEPVYITSINQASMPELKMIAVGYKDKIVMTPTLEQAISLIFDTKTTQISTVISDEDTLIDAINRTITRYNDLRGAAADNDWQAFGSAMNELQDAIVGLEVKKAELYADKDTQEQTEPKSTAE